MAEINLLKQSQGFSDQWKGVLPWVERLLILVMLAVLGYYAWTFYSIRDTESKTAQLTATLVKNKAAALNDPDRKQLLARQAQTKELGKIIDAHTYWSNLLPQLAKSTMNRARLLSFRAVDDDSVQLSVVVPTITDLDKFLQVFDQPQVYKNFYDVKISGISTVQEKGVVYTRFDISMKYNPAILQYNSAAK